MKDIKVRKTSSKDIFDVIIIGLGPVGATIANLLGKSGVTVLVLDREAQAYHLPRAVGLDDEVMRIFQTVGVADEVAARCRVNPGMRFVDADGNELLHWPRPMDVTAQAWHASYRFHQPELESTLRGALNRFPKVEVRTRCDAFLINDRGEDVEVRYEDLSTRKIKSASAKYVVGCDGARSLVRRFIESEMEDYGFHERWLVIDAILKKPKPELGDFSIQYCNPARPMTYVRGTGDRRRWEISLLDGEDTNQMMSETKVWELLKDWLTPKEAELERAAVYVFHSLIAKRWRRRRLFLAGDSAHQTPPFMGQGMCAGIRDVSNLAWKMALCIAGRADDNLLDTYQSERHPHVREFIETTVRLGGLINTSGTESALRAAFQQPEGPARMNSLAPKLGQGLSFGNTKRSGQLAPQIMLSDGRRLDDVAGYNPVLIIRREFFAQASDLKEELSQTNLMTIEAEDEPEALKLLDQLSCDAVVIRADRYFLGEASNLAELTALCTAGVSQALKSNVW